MSNTIQHHKQPTVLVVGAGPTGLVLATMLLRHGISVRLVDRLSEPQAVSKAFVIHARTLEIFEQMGVVDEVLEHGLRLQALQVYVHDRNLVSVGFSHLDTPYPFVLNLPQSETERILTVALEKQGGQVEREVELVQLSQQGQEVTVILRNARGQEEVITPRWVIGCDGAHSTVRHLLNLPFTGAAHPEGFALADVHLQWSLPYETLKFFFHQEGLFLAIPLPGGLYRLIAETTTNADKEPETMPTLEDFQRYLQERGPLGATVSQPIWMSPFRAHTRKVAHYRVGQVFLAGDAAHIHSPAAGQGMNTGIQDAYNLAWKLALVEKELAAPALLSTYQEERSPVATSVIRLSDAILRMGTLRHPLAQFLRNHLAPFVFQRKIVQKRLLGNISQLALTYRKSSLTGATGKQDGKVPRAGDRAPDGPIQTRPNASPARLFELLDNTRHTLLIFTGEQQAREMPSWVQETMSQLTRDYPTLIDTYCILTGQVELTEQGAMRLLSDPGTHLHRRYGMDRPGVVLIRPDGYISFRSQREPGQSLDCYLKQWFVSPSRATNVIHSQEKREVLP
jgi:2-polyprenyl-6-methoxyphenol hydroxylase-like FAD-dependent oxidoreductase